MAGSVRAITLIDKLGVMNSAGRVKRNTGEILRWENKNEQLTFFPVTVIYLAALRTVVVT